MDNLLAMDVRGLARHRKGDALVDVEARRDTAAIVEAHQRVHLPRRDVEQGG